MLEEQHAAACAAGQLLRRVSVSGVAREVLLEKIAGVDIGQEAPMKKIAFASFVGTAIEFYDFYI